MSRNSKKLAFIALVSLQSAFILAPGANPSSYSPLMSGVSQALADHAAGHAAHVQVVAEEASDHAAAMQVVADHLSAQQQAAEVKRAELTKAIVVVQHYINSPNPTNGTLKPGYDAYKKAAQFIQAHAHEYVEKALADLAQAYALLDMLPKNIVEAHAVEAELHMAMSALVSVLKKI